LADLAHSIVPAAVTTAADDLVGVQGSAGAAGDQLGEPGGSKAASKVASSTEGEGGEQQLGAFELFPPLLQPAASGDRGPEMAIIRILDELPPDESAHLRCKGKRAGCRAAAEADRGAVGSALAGSSGAEVAFKFYCGFLAEGTMAIEVRVG
jgi:hypothetical protein